MDSTVLGALIALGGALVGVLASAAVAWRIHRSSTRTADSGERRSTAVDMLQALVAMLHARASGEVPALIENRAEAIVNFERMLMLASERDVEHLERVLGFVIDALDKNSLPVASAAVEAMSRAIRGWVRGELRGEQIADAYGAALHDRLDRPE